MNDTKSAPKEASEPPASQDLSAEIARTIARAPGEQVTCRHIYGDRYRCNWWQNQNTAAYDNPAMPGLLVTTSRIGKSQFLSAKATADGLLIEVL